MHKITISLILFIISTSQCFSQEEKDSRWLDRNSEGYFWYKDEPEEPEEEINKLKTPPVPPAHSPPPNKVITTSPGPSPMSVTWIREHLPKYLDLAIDNPTDENVTAYLLLQKRAMDKSFVFTDAVQMIAQSNPLLDPNNERPTATFASKSLDALTSKYREDLTKKISETAAVIYFMDSSELTKIQNPIVDVIENTLGFATARIAIEPLGYEIPGKRIRENEGRNDVMNIRYYPAIVLITADGVYDIISQAPVSLGDFQQRTFMSAKRLGIISEDEFNRTRPLRNIVTKQDVQVEDPSQSEVPTPPNEVIRQLSGNN